MTHDPPEGVVRFTNGTDEVAYKMPHKIKQYNSLSDLERKHTKKFFKKNEEEIFTVAEDGARIYRDDVTPPATGGLILYQAYGNLYAMIGEFTLSSLDVLQGFSFFLQMGLTLILATLDGLDVGLLGDVIGEDDCDDDG
uniref:Uncharacterized protein n=1 Tax=Tanacetum cinerariifolium TaxID=118510 RepID=A0A6L2LFS0_TANCI|nr:hypothetical protein [Tanacetum cinerariifolium]